MNVVLLLQDLSLLMQALVYLLFLQLDLPQLVQVLLVLVRPVLLVSLHQLRWRHLKLLP